MTEQGKIECNNHGTQTETYVCQHIAASLSTKIPVGFHWPESSAEPYPDAWCSECESSRIEAGGEWTDEVVKKLGVKILCCECYTIAKNLSLLGLS